MEIFETDGNIRPPYVSGRNLYAHQEATEPDVEQRTSSKLEKEYDKSRYYYPSYLTSVQRTSCEIPGWMTHKLESSWPREISATSDMQMIPV